jgi:hypothetical protein
MKKIEDIENDPEAAALQVMRSNLSIYAISHGDRD